MTDQITGRDGYIMAEALILAINAIDSMDADTRPYSNRDDMMKLLFALRPDQTSWTVIANSVDVDPPPIDSPGYDQWVNAGRPELRLVYERPEPPPED